MMGLDIPGSPSALTLGSQTCAGEVWVDRGQVGSKMLAYLRRQYKGKAPKQKKVRQGVTFDQTFAMPKQRAKKHPSHRCACGRLAFDKDTMCDTCHRHEMWKAGDARYTCPQCGRFKASAHGTLCRTCYKSQPRGPRV